MSLITLILVLAAVAALIVVGTRKKDGGGKRALPRTVVTVAAVLVLIGALGFGSVYQLQEDEYAVGDRKSMEAGAGQYLNFLRIVLRKR